MLDSDCYYIAVTHDVSRWIRLRHFHIRAMLLLIDLLCLLCPLGIQIQILLKSKNSFRKSHYGHTSNNISTAKRTYNIIIKLFVFFSHFFFEILWIININCFLFESRRFLMYLFELTTILKLPKRVLRNWLLLFLIDLEIILSSGCWIVY